MPPSDVEPFDLQRMFFGEMSWLFTLEIVVRTVIIYLYTVGLVRIISKRAVGQLSLVEFLLVIALGSAVGDPMFYPDVPIIHAMVVISVVVGLNRGLLFMVNTAERFEQIVEGSPILLVRDGLIHVEQLHKAMLSQEKLYEKLRVDGIEHLGQVSWAFLEQGGEITVFRAQKPVPGLLIVPPWDLVDPTRYEAGTHADGAPQLVGCEFCGMVLKLQKDQELPPCSNCGGTRWADAVGLPAEGATNGALADHLREELTSNGSNVQKA